MINETHAYAYCCEDISKIENYDKAIKDEIHIWDCHHRLEIQGEFKNSSELLKKCKMYYNVPANQLIFLTKSGHAKLHMSGKFNPFYGKTHTEQTRKKISLKKIGNTYKHSNKAKEKIRKSKIGNKSCTGLLWWNDGEKNCMAKECPGKSWHKGRLRKN